jgi:hypothetical protein
MIALKSAFFDGKIPRWYARKNIPIWYEEIKKEGESNIKRFSHPKGARTNNISINEKYDLNNAMFKFALLINENPDEEEIKAISNKLKAILSPDEEKRIIELAEELKDDSEEIKQNTKEDSL